MDGTPITVMIVDDHQLIIDGLLTLLKDASDIRVLAEANDGPSILKHIALQQPDVLIMDVDMPMMSGRELAATVRKQYPQVQMLALTMHNDRAVIQAMTQAGAKGYLLKNTSQSDLLQAIRKVVKGKSFYSSEVTETLLSPTPETSSQSASLAVLTEREREILVLIAEGLSNTQIGESLFISPRTVDTHRTNLMKKLAVHNIAGLIRYAYRQGLVE